MTNREKLALLKFLTTMNERMCKYSRFQMGDALEELKTVFLEEAKPDIVSTAPLCKIHSWPSDLVPGTSRCMNCGVIFG